MFNKKMPIIMLCCSVFISAATARAREVSDLEARIACLEENVSAMDFCNGLSLEVHATMVIQGTKNANASGITTTRNNYKDDSADAGYSVDIEIAKDFDDTSKAFLCIETGEGLGVTDNLELFSNVNRDIDDSGGVLTVTELWWQQKIDDFAVLTFGKIDAAGFIDGNEYANDECSQFLGSIFRNSPAIEFPDNTVGVRLGLAFSEMFELDTVIVDGDADFSQTGDNPWIGIQLNIKPELLERSGKYRLLYWYNAASHVRWNDPLSDKDQSNGFGISIDQEIIDNIGIFIRAGRQKQGSFLDTAGDGITAEDFSLSACYSGGVQISGAAWNRENDVCGIGYGVIKPSDDYKQAQSRQAKLESHCELYYNMMLNENLHITPDLQIISNPFGKDAPNGMSTIIVSGIRVQIDF